MNKKSIIKLIILIIISILLTGTCVIFIIAGNKIHNDDYIVFSVIALMFILPFLIWEIIKILKPKKTPNNINEDILKQQIVDVAFNTFLREGQDYTIKASTEGAILVKKIARWAYFDASTNDIQACFSIETDKGIYCFQQKGNELSLIPTDISSSIYPELLPSTPKQVSIIPIMARPPSENRTTSVKCTRRYILTSE